MSKPKPVELSVVEWDDAWVGDDQQVTAHSAAITHKPLRIRTVGTILVDDETGISIANESYVDDQGTYRGRTFIPRAMIRSVETYRLVKKTPSPGGKSPDPPQTPPPDTPA